MKQTRTFGILVIFLILATIPNVEAMITLKTDKLTYNQGEIITFTIKNANTYTINFDDIMIKNTKTGDIISTWCSPDPNIVCTLEYTGPNVLNPGQIYTKTWYLNTKGTYRAYIDWWSEPTVVCLAIGCPEPEPGHSGRSYSNYFRIREMAYALPEPFVQ